jgi:hypothetical protein
VEQHAARQSVLHLHALLLVVWCMKAWEQPVSAHPAEHFEFG